ncbi:MAG: DNA repair ATPase, partial [Planctomycetales bacterium]|nr:DNA repair ATPase [Planctomycetales bacterium]
MSTNQSESPDSPQKAAAGDGQELERGTYEIIRARLDSHAHELRARLDKLNHDRREVFGSIETKLLATERITTGNNCVPCDMKSIGERFVFGYNVHIGLRSETHLEDVFSVHSFRDGTFHSGSLDLITDDLFLNDFKQLYKYYKDTTFLRFHTRGPHLYMVFRVGKNVTDVKAFKWFNDGESLRYMDNRSEHELTYPPQHEFEWKRTHRDLHRHGAHPHISIEDRIFVETVGGDLTIKVEDNTDVGHGIYDEPVDDPDQVLDDAEVFYAIVGNLILLKIRPYQEQKFRYLVYNDKLQKAMRLDTIERACVLLPEDHGLIFSNGYYLQTGEWKVYDNGERDLLFERRLASPNGEDDLYVFFNRENGVYVLLSYNMIEQHVKTPIVCHGFSFFPDGHLVFFKADDDPQKHHALQIWQTPYVAEGFTPEERTDSFLYKVGNKDIVRGMAECHEILNLIGKDESYSNLYVDLVKKSGDVVDSYFWIKNEETHRLDEPLAQIRDASAAAVSEYDKVVRVRRETAAKFKDVSRRTERALADIRSRRFDHINVFVESLAESRKLRGEIVSLRDLKYIDLESVDFLETEIADSTDRLSRQCVEFLLRDGSLTPYEKRVVAQKSRIDGLEKVSAARELENELVDSATELEMLIDVVSNLKIDDATQRTQIIDDISAIFANLNQARAALKKKTQQLLAVEGSAEFHSQIKLLSQAVVNYLDVCDTPEKCDEYLTKTMVQIEELEGQFAEFDEFVVQLSERREEVYSAFDTRKVAIVEARNRRATALQSAADRILNGIKTRVAGFDNVNDIHSYFASDLMTEKVRDIVAQLTELEDTVKVGDIQSRLKTIREDAVRQLKDRQELYVDGKNVIRFGKHLFSVNVQELELTTVVKDDGMYFHLVGTNYMELIRDERLQTTRDVWNQEVVSENAEVYRAEYLAYLYSQQILQRGPAAISAELEADDAAMTVAIQKFMAPRYAGGYVKGVHDHDAAKITKAYLSVHTSAELLRYPPSARALATVFWYSFKDTEAGRLMQAKLAACGDIRRLFPDANRDQAFVSEIRSSLLSFNDSVKLIDGVSIDLAAAYLCEELCSDHAFVADHRAIET